MMMIRTVARPPLTPLGHHQMEVWPLITSWQPPTCADDGCDVDGGGDHVDGDGGGDGDHVDGDGENESLVFDKSAAGKPPVMTIVRH